MINAGVAIMLAAFASSACADVNDLVLSSRSINAKISIRGNLTHAINLDTGKELRIDARLKQRLYRSEEIILLSRTDNSNRPHFVLLARAPSRPSAMGKGFCGAGYEENLILIEINDNVIRWKDQLELQSCLHSITIYTEKSIGSTAELLQQSTDGSYNFRYESDDSGQSRKLSIKNNRFNLELVPNSDQQ
jgi:hypothetical protein